MTGRNLFAFAAAGLALAVALAWSSNRPEAQGAGRASQSAPKYRVLFNRFQSPAMTIFMADADGKNEHALGGCFGLDFASVAEIRGQIMEQRNNCAALLLFSEDLDEILELADRIVVMYEGAIAGETSRADASVEEIGLQMAGGHAD